MTKGKKFKMRVRARQGQTGESYATVRAKLAGQDLGGGSDGFAAIVHQAIALAEAWERAKPPKKPGELVDLSDLAKRLLTTPWLSEKQAYFDFIESLDARTLQRLQTLMYFGRDYHSSGERDLHALHDSLGGSRSSAERASNALLGKSPGRVAGYLREGLRQADAIGVKLEERFGIRFPS